MPITGDATLEDYLRRLRREASTAFTGVVGRLLAGETLRPLPQSHRGPYYPPAGWTTQKAVRNYGRAVRGSPTPRRTRPLDPAEDLRTASR